MFSLGLALFSNAIWVFPALRQVNTKYRTYFLLAAVAGVSSLVFWKIRFGSNQNYFYLLISILSPYALKIEKRKIHWAVLITFGIALNFILYKIMNRELEVAAFLLCHFVVMIMIFRRFISEALETHTLNVFQLLIVAYELSIVIRAFYALISTAPSIYYYFTAMILEMMICVVFSILRERHPLLLISIGKAQQ